MRVKHPETIDGVGGHPPHSVTLNGTIYPLDDGEADIPERDAEALADLYGVDLSDIRVDDPQEACGAEKADGSICKRPADSCPYHTDT